MRFQKNDLLPVFHHERGIEARRVDQHRTEYLENEGYRVLRFWNEEVLDNADGVLEEIAKFL